MKIQKLIFAAALVIVGSTNIFSQTIASGRTMVGPASDTEKDSHSLTIGIPQVALLDIESTATSNGISLNAAAPTEAGEKVTFNQTNNNLWLNYSSIVGNESSRSVTVQITDGDVPEGINLTVLANKYVGEGEGSMGTASEESIILNDKKAETIIRGIGSAYTGNGATNGHNLTYKIAQSDDKDAYQNLNFDQSTTLTITYTLTDN